MPGGRSGARVSTWLGNLFLGIAIGLLGYYFATDVVTWAEQRALRVEMPARAAAVESTEATSAIDLTGWEAEDAAYWRGLKPGGVFGRLVAETARIDSMVIAGTTRAELRKGPGWIMSTGLPGASGNCGISGHRTTFGAPFKRLDQLRVGDTIRFYSPFREYTYEVVDVFTVTPDRVDVIASTLEPMLTLTACHPPYSAKYRLIVQSRLVAARRLER